MLLLQQLLLMLLLQLLMLQLAQGLVSAAHHLEVGMPTIKVIMREAATILAAAVQLHDFKPDTGTGYAQSARTWGARPSLLTSLCTQSYQALLAATAALCALTAAALLLPLPSPVQCSLLSLPLPLPLSGC